MPADNMVLMTLAVHRSLFALLALVSSGLITLACTRDEVRTTFANQYDCNDVAVKSLGAGRYSAHGCGRTVVYTCVDPSLGKTACVTDYEVDQTDALDRVRARSVVSHSRGAKVRRNTEDGAAELKLDVILDTDSMLKLRATPAKTGETVVLHVVHDGDLKDCELSWMLNGTRQEGEVKFKVGKYSAAKMELSRPVVEELGMAQQLAFKACGTRWSLSRPQLEELQRFVSLYEEELAWGQPKREGGTGGRLAPLGGWLPWNPQGDAPKPSRAQSELDAKALFQLLAPSVVQVEGLTKGVVRQGSAVAVSSTELLTNCHVIESARKIVAHQNDKKWTAKLARSDPAGDRCVLTVEGSPLQPVPGVRPYDQLSVGEQLYTLGSPDGLELSLASGILSGLRKDDTGRYIQTTAPISPGSSGGGLFDTRGNLVGITVGVRRGRDKSNQSLNFALPASDFWKP